MPLQLESEGGRYVRKFFTIDGNMSFSRYRIDNENASREFDDHGLHIPAETVAQFEDPRTSVGARMREDGCGMKEPSNFTDPAVAEKSKRPLSQTGLFPLVCRHGFVWSYINMEGTTGEP